jgi:hypothetical protein
MKTPSDFLVEHGWGGRDVDDATWQPKQLATAASFWGHDGLFRQIGADDEPPPAADQRLAAAGIPMRAPLQVMDGNFERMSGVCPWWDAVKGR